MEPLLGLLLALVTDEQLAAFSFAVIRIGSFLLTAPLLSMSVVSPLTRGVASLAFALVVHPTLSVPAELGMVNGVASLMVVAAVHEVITGLLMGFVFYVTMEILRIAGLMMSYATQLGMSQMVDPATQSQSAVLDNFLYYVGRLYFLAAFGVSFMLGAVFKSFETIPIGHAIFADLSPLTVALWTNSMWAHAMMMAIPSFGVALTLQGAMAVITRSAPTLNIFSIGFPIVIAVGIYMFGQFAPVILRNFEAAVPSMLGILAGVL
ncbi:flagellar biosynthetic protein FliR [Ferrimonas marina]|uniref:Flagellar biosynthetic protein FliR n=1 Tax=Ferrimonas marina TaxID=299255 RepID=A0A1M5TG25_9GAMM|nr:flagellar biosynthetic protein FliR [Ferrimonas marina]SHH49702.1 flagellar biosynthetic protein FliR [Ferrimonas marina]